ncbi:MAG: hypothetical protein R3E21_02395 [Caenibius sp.]
MKRASGKYVRGRFSASAALALAMVALPSAGLALGSIGDDGLGATVSLAARGSFASFTPASVDPELARLVSSHASSKGRLMRFTPAGAANRPDRAVTVAVRIDDETARAISVRTAIASAKQDVGKGVTNALGVAPTRYDLGVARGYRSFAQSATVPGDLRRIEMPDLSTFKAEGDSKPSRFAARIELEENGNVGRAPRTIDAVDAQRVDLGGSYRVTRNLDLTAGLRYSQERARLAPLTDGVRDSQAVYVGTQFRF